MAETRGAGAMKVRPNDKATFFQDIPPKHPVAQVPDKSHRGKHFRNSRGQVKFPRTTKPVKDKTDHTASLFHSLGHCPFTLIFSLIPFN
jgi:hypothetical protein